MDKIIPFVLAVAVSVGTCMALANYDARAQRNSDSEARLALDGPFRDGLYVGRLAAEGGRASLPPVGRWSSERDRASFTAGYRRGYSEFVAGNSVARNASGAAQPE
jgi:hypothetical protein